MGQESRKPASLLILSGGVGARSKHHEPKQFYELAGHPLVAHTIIAAVRIEEIDEIVINAPEGFEQRTKDLMDHYAGGKDYKVVPAGKTRQESSRILSDAAKNETIILHEAARPFVTRDMYLELLNNEHDNVGYCYEIPFSMCRIDRDTQKIKKGVSREKVFNIQLPQKFKRSDLVAAHAKAGEKKSKVYTEDAVMVVKNTDAEVFSLPGTSRNRKITTQEDFLVAEQIMKKLAE